MKTGFSSLLTLALLAAPATAFAQAKPKDAKGKEAAEWGQYRGPNRDGLSPDTGLLKAWPAGGPPLAWKATGLGEGWSSVVIHGGRIYTMGESGGACNLIAIDAAEGKILWQSKVGETGAIGGYAGPRSTPATDGTHVYGLSQHGDLACVQAATGAPVWKRKMDVDFGGEMMSQWGYSESPLLDGAALVVMPGGSRGTVAALNKTSGATLWQGGQLKDKAPYTSLVPVDFGGLRQYIVFTDQSVAALAARTGQLVWKSNRPGQTAVVPTPVVSKTGIVFVSSGYGVGCNAFVISGGGGSFRSQEAYSGKQLQNHHGGIVLVGDYVYGLDDRGPLKCLDLRTGKVVWENPSVGKGSIAYADGHLICQGERGAVALVEATPAAYKEKGRFTPSDRSGRESWAHPVVFGGRLYLRDQGTLLSFDLKVK